MLSLCVVMAAVALRTGPGVPIAQKTQAEAVLLLRWVLIIATSYLVVFSRPLNQGPASGALFVAMYFASNIILSEVLPHTENVEEFASRSRRVRPFPGPMLCRRPGSGTQFYGIRDYLKGDPLRNINWKLLAKRRKLMVNDYEKEALSDIVIIIDAREVGNCGTVSCNPLEYGVKGASSLARYFIYRRDKVGLVVYGRGVDTIPPRAGSHHLDTLVAHLTAVEGAGATTFGEAMKLVQPYLAPGTALVLITPLEFDPTLTPKAAELLASGHPVIILSPGPFQFETVAMGTADPKYELPRLERQNFMDNLRFFGIEIVDWTPEMKVWELIERCEHAR